MSIYQAAQRRASDAFAALKRLESDPIGYTREMGATAYAQALAAARQAAGQTDAQYAAARTDPTK